MQKNKNLNLEAVENSLSYEEISKKIEPGEITTYKEICNRLGIPYYTGGDQKKAQVKELKRYFDYEPVNRKWMITDIYSSPLDKEARAVPQNSIYVKYVECILLQYLANMHGNEAYLTKNRLWLLLGMINDKYNTYKDNYEDLEKTDKLMTFFEVNDFYKRSSSYLSKIVERSLHSLDRRSLIFHNEVYMITEKTGSGDYHYFEADVRDTEEILKVKRKTLLSFGLEDEGQLIFKGIKFRKEYYAALDKTFQDEYGWEKVYKAYHIIYNQQNAIEALSQDQISLQRLAVNERVINKINAQAENIVNEKGIKSDAVLEKVLEGESIKFTYPEVYLEVQKMLSDKLLKIEMC